MGAERPGAAEPGALGYDEQKRLARDRDPAVRRRLAERQDVRPEILYFLAADGEPEVRRAIAHNQTTPRQADLLLVEDDDEEARCLLAKKIGRLAPDLEPAQRDHLQDLTIEILDLLTQDQLPRVRRIVAEEIKHLDNIPRELIDRLARDIELAVCAPVLEFSPLLNDDDLLEIIGSDPVQGALSAISKRHGVSAIVSDAIVAAEDEEAVAALLSNESAQIREETLDRIVAAAPAHAPWHRPLVERPDLSHRAVKNIARFVTSTLLDRLAQRYGLDEETARRVSNAVSDRLAPDGLNLQGRPNHRAMEAYDAQTLDDEAVMTALVSNDRRFVVYALALKSRLPTDVVRKMLNSGNPRAVTVLAWKAGFKMRTALQLQLRAARIPHREALHPRNGIDYPLSAEELEEQLQFFADFFSKGLTEVTRLS